MDPTVSFCCASWTIYKFKLHHIFSPVTWEFHFVCHDLVWVVDIWWFVYLDWNSIRLMFPSCIFRLLRNYYRSFMKLQLVWWWDELNRFLRPSQNICCFGKIDSLSRSTSSFSLCLYSSLALALLLFIIILSHLFSPPLLSHVAFAC